MTPWDEQPIAETLPTFLIENVATEEECAGWEAERTRRLALRGHRRGRDWRPAARQPSPPGIDDEIAERALNARERYIE
jgi:hypothetical protein